ncbi:DUF4231 domain-containing protein [Nocardia sp. NPDC051756]|uniref:DUF4231 domain-containing protein n=1 Tax=Nocardia sp. NPDC051756 TaxID=3154751 RepID=UPI00342CC8A0
MTDSDSVEQYAVGMANASYDWYVKASKRSRRYHRLTEAIQLAGSASIPVFAAMFSGNTILPAVIGSLVVVVTGLRSLFLWQENYLRYSKAREAVEAERRKYRIRVPPYDVALTRDQRLVEAVTAIESGEMTGWFDASSRGKVSNSGQVAVTARTSGSDPRSE